MKLVAQKTSAGNALRKRTKERLSAHCSRLVRDSKIRAPFFLDAKVGAGELAAPKPSMRKAARACGDAEIDDSEMVARPKNLVGAPSLRGNAPTLWEDNKTDKPKNRRSLTTAPVGKLCAPFLWTDKKTLRAH
jgi:hypothetical protein